MAIFTKVSFTKVSGMEEVKFYFQMRQSIKGFGYKIPNSDIIISNL